MKTKFYYLFLLILFLTSCERTSNVSESRIIGQFAGVSVVERTINKHDYIRINREYAHSGTCRKCKQERDSIIQMIIKTIKENKDNITWE